MATAGGAFGLLLGCAVLAGWVLGVESLQSVLPALPHMTITTATWMAMTGASVLLLRDRDDTRRCAIGHGIAAVVATSAVAALIEAGAGVDLRWDRLLVPDVADHVQSSRPPVMTAAAFLTLSLDLALLRARSWRAVAAGRIAAYAHPPIAILGVTTWIYGVQTSDTLAQTPGMALHGAIGIAALSAAATALPPDGAVVSLLSRRGPSRELARIMLPAALALPIALGGLELLGQQLGLYGPDFGPAMFSTAVVVGLVALVVTTARTIDRHEAARRSALDALISRERLFRTLTSVVPVGVFEADTDGMCVYTNAQHCDISGRSSAELLGEGWVSALHPDDREAVMARWTEAMRTGSACSSEHRLARPDGSIAWVATRGRAVLGDDGAVAGFVGAATDVTAYRKSSQDLRASEERFRGAFDGAPIGMAILELDGSFARVNPALCELSGYAPEELRASTAQAVIHPDDMAGVGRAVELLLDGHTRMHQGEIRILHADGTPVWVALSLAEVRTDEEPARLLAQVQDITERRTFESRLQHLADHDPLTGLLNRRRFEQEIDRHVGQTARYGYRGALLVLDLDNFKLVNDTLGHNVGDELITTVAQALRTRLRESDVVARLGGDEFAVLLPHSLRDDADAVAQELVRTIRTEASVMRDGRLRRVTASVGVAMFGPDVASGEDVIMNADLAMYDAKDAGRDRVAHFASADAAESRTKTRLNWIDRIRAALDENRFTLYAQPIKDLRTGQVARYELLLRMIGESGETIPPGAFLDVAERHDLVQEIDMHVTERAIAVLAADDDALQPLRLEVNLSAKSLGHEPLIELVEERLRLTGIDPGRLIFEMTETAAVSNLATARRFAQRLGDLGCKLALDDFGAGFGSFYYLKHLPFDYVKIDGEFVSQCRLNLTDRLVIDAVVAVARGLGKETIAEFVTEPATETFLRAHGVDFAQGYSVGRPEPIEMALGRRRRALRQAA